MRELRRVVTEISSSIRIAITYNHKMQNEKVQNEKCKMQNAEFKMQKAKCKRGESNVV